jgi:hypothetical protein
MTGMCRSSKSEERTRGHSTVAFRLLYYGFITLLSGMMIFTLYLATIWE